MAQGQGSKTATVDAPDTLPGDFFDKQKQEAPDTLPGDFFEKKPAAAQPIQDKSTIGARPSLGSRAWSAFKAGGPTALGEELGRSTKEAVGNLPLPGVGKTVGQGLEDLGRMTDMASTEASLLSLPQFGEGIVNLARGGVPALRAGLARVMRNPATGRVQTPWEIAVDKLFPDPNAPTAIPARPIPKGTNYGQFLENQKAAAKIAGPTGKAASKIAGPSVSVLPEPRAPMPGDRPGAMWSVGREDVLPSAAQRGTPGAGDVMRNIGEPIIYTPKEGVGYPGPRAEGRFQGMVAAPEIETPAPAEPKSTPHRFSNSARVRQKILDQAKEK